ncbi:MAG: LmbU family transcriptional regulator [Solirubrobacteraceae bacterium]
MRLNPRLPYEIWQGLGVRIVTRAESASWWLGDWMVFGEQQYGQRYRQAIETTGLDYQTLRNYAVVARRFKLSRRRDNLSFQHHAEVCALPFEEQDRWLDLAAENHWSKRELRLRLREATRGDAPREERHPLRVMVDLQQEDRWRRASARSGCSFEDWIVRSLDAAAGGFTS